MNPKISELQKALEAASYVADEKTAMSAFLALELGKPLLVEGPPGAGKTELAYALGRVLQKPVERLQCYEGLDEARALYEWDYGKQILFTQLLRDVVQTKIAEASSIAGAIQTLAPDASALFSERFLLARPILRALMHPSGSVLLIDEVDRSDPEFEAFLLEVLSEYQVTIPELGTVRAVTKPVVILTSNAAREMTDALRRRCLFLSLDYPTPSREIAIIQRHVPEAAQALTEQLIDFASRVRQLELDKTPSISEVIDWARAIITLGANTLDRDIAEATLGVLLKHTGDQAVVTEKMGRIISS